jgi:hypothetical protein
MLYICLCTVFYGYIILQYKLKQFAIPIHLSGAMELYCAIYNFVVFINADREVLIEVKMLDFDNLDKQLASLPHLQLSNPKQKIVEDPFDKGENYANWRVYHPESKDIAKSTRPNKL